MCGIVGIYSFNHNQYTQHIQKAVDTLISRGPDEQSAFQNGKVTLGHTRLAIIDTSQAASQPLSDESGRYTIIFNGEIYNFQSLRDELKRKGYSFFSTSDTEVLLKLYIHEGVDCLQKIHGFFAFAIYDKNEESLFVARDRMGIKPVLMYHSNDAIILASEMKALMALGIPKELDYNSLHQYFQFNYIPGPHSIFKNVRKLRPGNYLMITPEGISEKEYYAIPHPDQYNSGLSYESAKHKLYELLDESVRMRLVSDVPLGSFLSGGIDSSVVVALASKYTNQLKTFSIGYANEPFFDETNYAQLVAQKFKTQHTVFKLTNDDLFQHIFNAIDYLDEPFADSSALPVYILSKHTREHVTVALSGDGADELFSGYHKHLAHYLVNHPGGREKILTMLYPFIKLLPQSRNTKFSNAIRQAVKFYQGVKQDPENRYWQWCAINNVAYSTELLITESDEYELFSRRNYYTDLMHRFDSVNDILYADMHMVLQNDMLTKVDLMSMANSLEVRTPFLEHKLVDFVFSLPGHYKINRNFKKKIVQDTFRDILPEELYNRPKKGFEVPLLKWFRKELFYELENYIFDKNFIEEQKIFNWKKIVELKNQLFSNNPGEISAQIWALLVFQRWWKNYFN